MKKIIRFITYLIIASCLIISCDWIKSKIHTSNVEGQVDTTEVVLGASPKMFYTLDKNLGKSQLDSMIAVDNLVELDQWIPSSINYNGKVIKQYLLIKTLEEENELIYTVTLTSCDTIFKCTKRIVE